MRIVFRDTARSYLLMCALGIMAGLSVIFFCEFPNSDLWAFSYWSSETVGFWMFSTSLIVLLSEKRKTAAVNATIYIFFMFFITNIYESCRLYFKFYTPFHSLLDLSLNRIVYDGSRFMIWFHSLLDLSLNSIGGWFLYSVLPAAVCGILGAVLWSGRKDHVFGKILCILPAVFILAETIALFHSVFNRHTKLFSATTDLIWFIAYAVFLKSEVFIKRD